MRPKDKISQDFKLMACVIRLVGFPYSAKGKNMGKYASVGASLWSPLREKDKVCKIQTLSPNISGFKNEYNYTPKIKSSSPKLRA